MFALNDKEFKLTTQKYIILLLCLTTVLILPLIDNKNIPGHDYVFHVIRILDVAEALQEGVFPVRMFVDEVRFWGAPIGIFYPSFFVYFPALLKLVGVPIEICYNFFIAMIFYLGSIASWYGFSMLTRSKKTGLFSAVLYISSEWYLLEAYIRNALGELLGLSFLPLAIAYMIAFITKTKLPVKHYILGILSISVIIESHVLTSAFIVLFSLCLFFIHFKRLSLIILKRIFYLSLIIFFLNSSFIVPFLVYYYKVPIKIDFIEYFSQGGWSLKVLLFHFLFFNAWLFMSSYFFLITLLNNFYKTLSCNINRFNVIILSSYGWYFLLGLLFLFLTSNLMPWDILKPLKKIFEVMQFTWRFLGPATLFLCICGGFGLRLLLQKIKVKNISIVLLLLLICVTNMFTLNYRNPSPFHGIPKKVYWDNNYLSSSDYDYLYKGMDTKALRAQGNHFISDAVIYNWQKKITTISFYYSTHTDSEIILPLVNYPGYVALTRDGKKIPIKETNNHMMTVPLRKGEGSVEVKYEGLLLFKIADMVSLISLISLLLFGVRVKGKREWRRAL